MTIQRPKENRERGSALLLSLGILSLVMIIAMSFMYSANTSLSVAKAQGDASRARLVADEGVENVLTEIRTEFIDLAGGTGKKLAYPPLQRVYAGSSSDWAANERFDGMRFMQLVINSLSVPQYFYAFSRRYYNSLTPDEQEQKQQEQKHLRQLLGLADSTGNLKAFTTADFPNELAYLPMLRKLSKSIYDNNNFLFSHPLTTTYYQKDPEGTVKTKTEVTGRYAYILFDESNKLDINAVINRTRNVQFAMDDNKEEPLMLNGGMYLDRIASRADWDYYKELRDNGDEPSYFAFDIYSDSLTTLTNLPEENATVRLGLSLEEIAAGDENYLTMLPLTFRNNSGTGPHFAWESVRYPWSSYQQLARCSLTGTPHLRFYNETEIYANSLSPVFTDDVFLYTFFSAEEPESFRRPDDTTDNEYARFDLSGVSWAVAKSEDEIEGETKYSLNFPVLQVDDDFSSDPPLQLDPQKTGWDTTFHQFGKLSNPDKAVERLVGTGSTDDLLEFGDYPISIDLPAHNISETVLKDIDPLDSKVCIFGLKEMVDDAGNSVGEQVAANIIDYSDSDSFATISGPSVSGNYRITPYNDPDTSEIVFPQATYCGNEKVAYINRVQIKSGIEVTTGGGTYLSDYTLHLMPAVQLLNIYCCKGLSECDTIAGHVKVFIKGRVRVKRLARIQRTETNSETGVTSPMDANDVASWEDNASANQDDWENIPADITGLSYVNDSGGSDDGEAYFPMRTVDGSDFIELSTIANEWEWFDPDPDTNSAIAEDAGTPLTNHHMGYQYMYFDAQLRIPGELQNLIHGNTVQDVHGNTFQEGDGAQWKYRYDFKFDIEKIIVLTWDKDAGKPGRTTDVDTNNLYDWAKMPDPVPDPNSMLEPCYKDQAPYDFNSSGVDDFEHLDILLDFQCKDCRCNHRPEAWEAWDGTSTLPGLEEDNTSLASAANSGASASNAIDLEGAVTFLQHAAASQPNDQVSYSTAFIRNAPMESLWELGAIHRGGINQTINLKKYNTTSSNASRIEDYAGGDAALLDYVKIGPLRYTKGKVNANVNNPLLWAKVFDNLTYNFYDNVRENGVVPPCFQPSGSTSPYKIALTNFSASALNASGSAAQSRGAFANRLSGTMTAANDRDAEAVIGRTAQLLSTRYCAFTALVVGEALREYKDMSTDEYNALKTAGVLINPTIVTVGDEPVDPDSDHPRIHYCSIMGHQKVLLHLLWDSWTNKTYVVKKQYLED